MRQLILGLAFGEHFALGAKGAGNWPMHRLVDICDVRDGTHDSPKKSVTGYPLATSKNLKNGQVDLSSSYLISEEDYVEINRRSQVNLHDVLISMIGTVGQVAVVDVEPKFAIKNVGLVKAGSKTLARFLAYYLISPAAKRRFTEASSGGIQKFLSLGKLRETPVPLPQDETQFLIVSKVDELMALCDELEAKLISRIDIESAFAHASSQLLVV